MTRSFSKSHAHASLKLTTLCLALALGWMVQGKAATPEAETQMATTADTELAMAHIC